MGDHRASITISFHMHGHKAEQQETTERAELARLKTKYEK